MTARFRHHLRTLHPVLIPSGVLFAAFLAMLSVAEGPDTRSMLIQMATGIAVLVSVWLLLRQYLDTLIMGAQGFDQAMARVARLESIHADEIARWERRRAGGPDTPMPVDPIDPTL